MTKKTDKKTTVGIAPADAGSLYKLAEALGFRRAGGGNLTAMLGYQIQMIDLYGPRVVAEALAQDNLAALAEEMQEADDGR